MIDHVTSAKRSEIMRAVGTRDTAPELAGRRLIHRAGFRYRLHVKGLPGTPDIVLPRHRKVILVHGCYWHGHEGCPKGRLPNSRPEYWAAKIAPNRKRGRDRISTLQKIWLALLDCLAVRASRA